jgi:hypothetical protein
MKTLKARIIPGIVLIIATLPILFTSCTDETIDLRDQITGQYSYTVKIYSDNGTDLQYLGGQNDIKDITGTMRVSKNVKESGVLDFFDGTDLMFQGMNVKDAGNAIVFDIPAQEAWIGPGTVQVAGYQYWNFNSAGYHGAFIYDDKSVEVAFAARIMEVDTGLVMILTASRN